MKASRPIDIPEALRFRHYSILISTPEHFAFSNGISVLLNAALNLQSLGLQVDIVPAHTTTPTYTRLPEPYADLPICWEIRPGCSAILSDTVSQVRLQEVRARAGQICHYTMAPNGLFGSEGMWANRIWLESGESQAVYSPQISTQLPTFYLQSHFADLEPWIELACRQPRQQAPHHLRACLYPGKGHLRRAPRELCNRIKRSRCTLITRYHPANKPDLYHELANSDLLICYDPITSLAYEASLLGIPVFIPIRWDESHFKPSFPVRLDGIVWGDMAAFLDILDHGFDHQSVLNSYRTALANNTQTLVDLLHFAFSNDGITPDADRINLYWDSRQAYFSSLQLPSFANRWTLKEALPATTPIEGLNDLLETFHEYLSQVGHHLSCRWRSIMRRIAVLRHLSQP